MTTLDDGIAELLANPTEQTAHRMLLDRLEEEHPDPRRALTELVCREPANDGPRLTLACWLEAREPERAEFICVQCEIAERVRANWEIGLSELRHRERELLPANGRNARAWFDGDWWGDGLCNVCPDGSVTIIDPAMGARYDPPPRMRYTFARGFVDALTLPAADWLAHCDSLLAAHPITACRLTTRPTMEAMRGRWPGQVIPGLLWLEMWQREWPGITFALPS